jgi:predicted dienelactone hydrolase
MGWFGIAMAREDYVVIAVDHPGNNGMDPMTVAGATLWWERAEDLKRALTVVSSDKQFRSHIDTTRVGAAGFSAGGFTALVLGGARVNRARYLDFCHSHPQDGVCRPQVEFSVTEADFRRALQDPQFAAIEARASDDHSVPAVKAVFAMAPALVQALEPESLKAMHRAVDIVAGDADIVAPPDTNANVAAREIPGAQLQMVPKAGHYAFLASCTPFGAANVPVCTQAGSQDDAHRIAIEQAKALFRRAF